jgi:hypothetical protein
MTAIAARIAHPGRSRAEHAELLHRPDLPIPPGSLRNRDRRAMVKIVKAADARTSAAYAKNDIALRRMRSADRLAQARLQDASRARYLRGDESERGNR